MIAYIALGSNLKTPEYQLSKAIAHTQALSDTVLCAASSVYRTAPVGVVEQPDFLNQVVAVDTKLSAVALLRSLLAIEDLMGRLRTQHWGPRVIDCDLLLYGDICVETDFLTLPHPHMTKRAFVLYPLAEIAPNLQLPSGQFVNVLCEAVSDQSIQKVEIKK